MRRWITAALAAAWICMSCLPAASASEPEALPTLPALTEPQQETEEPDFGPEPVPEETFPLPESPQPEEDPASGEAEAPLPDPQPAAAAAQTPGIPTVTKDPTDETLQAGGTAIFIARADYWRSVVWHLGPGNGTEYPVSMAEKMGARVTNQDPTALYLNNVPQTMNGWKVTAEFAGRNGNCWSSSAVLHVSGGTMPVPVIRTQPCSVSAEPGTPVRLWVETDPIPGVTLHYRWYCSSEDGGEGEVIPGADSNVFYPDESSRTQYYYCELEAVGVQDKGETVVSRTAAVSFVPQAPTRSVKAASPQPQEPGAELSTGPEGQEDPQISAVQLRSWQDVNLPLAVLAAMIAAAGLAGALIMFVRMRRSVTVWQEEPLHEPTMEAFDPDETPAERPEAWEAPGDLEDLENLSQYVDNGEAARKDAHPE